MGLLVDYGDVEPFRPCLPLMHGHFEIFRGILAALFKEEIIVLIAENDAAIVKLIVAAVKKLFPAFYWAHFAGRFWAILDKKMRSCRTCCRNQYICYPYCSSHMNSSKFASQHWALDEMISSIHNASFT